MLCSVIFRSGRRCGAALACHDFCDLRTKFKQVCIRRANQKTLIKPFKSCRKVLLLFCLLGEPNIAKDSAIFSLALCLRARSWC